MSNVEYITIFHSQVLEAIESIIDLKLLGSYSVSDIFRKTNLKEWVVELKPDARKRLKNKA